MVYSTQAGREAMAKYPAERGLKITTEGATPRNVKGPQVTNASLYLPIPGVPKTAIGDFAPLSGGSLSA
jgi:hypothetical protein